MEIGSFIEMEFDGAGEYYKGENVIALNSGRAAIYHAARILDCKVVWIPFYQCPSVRDFLIKMGIKVKYYHIDKNFDPIDINQGKKEAVLIVNYFGIMSDKRMAFLRERYDNVIIDNSQAFFKKPDKTCMNVYSARKFTGVADGAYVVGNGADEMNDYDQDYSSDTSLFLLRRIEHGCEGETYKLREENEKRIENSPPLKMSALTKVILGSVDYEKNKAKRKENFETACRFFDDINMLNPRMYYDWTCVPMVYPLLVEKEGLLAYLLEHKLFQGHWWAYLLKETDSACFEHYMSEYMIPISIDQRYSKKELEYTYNLVRGFLKK